VTLSRTSAVTLPKVLELTDRELSGFIHRWVVVGDPGAGKTTLLHG
jgi:GTPase SAR1 family protein